jgi:hypothetical protein
MTIRNRFHKIYTMVFIFFRICVAWFHWYTWAERFWKYVRHSTLDHLGPCKCPLLQTRNQSHQHCKTRGQ